MKFIEEVQIQGTKEAIWNVITDIENSPNTISGIENVEIHNHPGESLVGLKWTETRTMFGKTATETMWITEAEKYKYYQTRAESHGAIYTSVLRIVEKDSMTYLNMAFNSEPQNFGAKIMGGIMGLLFKKATRKVLQQDLVDIKNAVENT